METKSYSVGEVTYTQKPLLMTQLGVLWSWVEGLPAEHILHNLTTMKESDTNAMLSAIRKMLVDGTLLEALSLVLVPDTPMEEKAIESHLKENLDAPTGIRVVTDFFIFNMGTLSESSALIQGQSQEMDKILKDVETTNTQSKTT